MARVKNSTTKRNKHRSMLSKTKGFRLKRKNVFKRAKEAILKAGPYAYKHRKMKKRVNRRLWNIKINAAARLNGTTYSKLIKDLKDHKIDLNRKVLAQIAEKDAEAFKAIVQSVAK